MKTIRAHSKRTILFLLAISLVLSFNSIQIGLADDDLPEEQRAEEPISVVIVNGRECVDGEVLIRFKDGREDDSAGFTLDALNSEIIDEPSKDIVLTQTPEGKTVKEFIDELEEQDNIEYVQPNYIYRLDATVNDPAAQMPDPDQWYLDTINAFEAWDITMGSSDIIVAVIDSGIDLDHPDLAGQVYLQTDTVDDDGNADDDDGHGTHVAGIIAANDNNNIGVVGIAPNTKLIIADVFGWHSVETSPGVYDDDFFALTSDIVEGINYSVSNGANVINMSFGDYSADTALEQALAAAVSAGVVCVASAGNDGTSDDHYPSDYDECISVIWTDMFDLKDPMANYGPQKDISAPGGSSTGGSQTGILSTYWADDDPERQYAYLSGSSMASPMVAAAAALILSVNPDLSVAKVKDILFNSAVDLGSAGRDDEYGYGRVDVQAAVLSAINTVYSQGSGTQADPYLIYTARQLNCIRYFPSSHFRLCSDIDMGALMHDGTDYYNGGKGWEPITLFSGSLNGDGHNISGLLCNRPGEVEVGLIKRLAESAVVENLNMTGHNIVGSGHAGAIAAYNYGTIQNCNTDGSVYSSDSFLVAGGIAGYNGYQILNCSNAGSVYKGAGIVGDNDQRTLIDGCINMADITQGSGILCSNLAGTITNCANFGNILGSPSQTGGIAGYDSYGIYQNCFNAGIVCTSNNTAHYAGVGGIIGYAPSANISNCFNVGRSYELEFGSIAGFVSSGTTIINCYNANFQTYNIFFELYYDPVVNNSYFLYDGLEDLGPMAKTSAELKIKSTYETYNFSSIWSIIEGERFAVLRDMLFTYISDFTLDKDSMDIFIGQEETLSPIFTPDDATNKSILWTSANENIATADDGVVTGISKGTTVITAKTADGTFISTCTVDVKQPISNIYINKETLSLVLGTQGQLSVTVLPEDAINKNVIWSSADTGIATVNNEGLVTSVSTGTTTITAASEEGGIKDTCTVYVTSEPIAVAGVYLNLHSAELVIGDTLWLSYTLIPVNATNSNVIWSSSDENLATVDDGMVTTKGVGRVKITVTTEEGGYTDTCDIVVTDEFDIIVFPDDNLKQALFDNGVDANDTGEITKTEMAAFTEALYLGGDNISNLSGLEHAINTDTLFLNSNNIVNLTPISGLTQLKHLYLEQNEITDISPLAGLVNLESLVLDWNDISDISALSGMSMLKYLSVYRNDIVDIDPLAELYNLENVDLEYNSITDISSLANLTKLTILDLCANDAEDFSPLVNLTNMQSLDLRANNCNDIYSLRDMTKLTSLDISYLVGYFDDTVSNISVLSNFSNLEELWVINNKITDISWLENLTGLRTLDISSNYIRDISCLVNLVDLTELSISSNLLSDISALVRLNNLRSLSISEANVKDIASLTYKTTIQELDISLNPISDISIISTLTGLEDLDLTNCMIDDISALENLDLDYLEVEYNELDISTGSEDRRVIDTLQSRGCSCKFDPQGNRFILAPGRVVNRTISAIIDVKPGTTLAELKLGLYGDFETMKFRTADGNYGLSDDSVLTTGSYITLNTEEEYCHISIMILGDINMDGKISITDYTLTRLDILELKSLGGIEAAAADINGDGVVSITDYTLIRLDILDLKPIQ